MGFLKRKEQAPTILVVLLDIIRNKVSALEKKATLISSDVLEKEIEIIKQQL